MKSANGILRPKSLGLKVADSSPAPGPQQDELRAEALAQLYIGVERMSRLVAQLLSLARNEPTAVKKLALHPLDLSKLAFRSRFSRRTPRRRARNGGAVARARRPARPHGQTGSVG